MTKTKQVSVEEETIATEEVQQDELKQEAPASDRKLILAPLAKYGVIAIVMVSIIVTTAIMMNREFNEIDAQVAALDAEIAQRDLEVVQSKATITEEVAVVEAADTNETEIVAEVITTETTPVQTTLPEAKPPVATTPIAPVTVAAPTQHTITNVKSRIAEHHKLLAALDKKQLKIFKANQAKQIEILRAQLVNQQNQITAIELRNQKSYEMRAAAVKRMQETREQSLNRI